MRPRARSAAQLYALALGALLVAAGVAGFFWSASFATGASAGVEQGFLLDVLAVNGWHNLLHLATGAVGLAVASRPGAARLYALALGLAYSLLALLGAVAESSDALFGLFAINTEDNVLHLLIAATGMATGLVTPSPERPSASAAS